MRIAPGRALRWSPGPAFCIAGWIEAALASKEIRDNRRYREAGYVDFDTYSRERWGNTRPTIDRMIRSAEATEDLGPMGPIALPATERQARELARVEPERRAEVWRTVVANHGEQPTAAQIRQTAVPPMP